MLEQRVLSQFHLAQFQFSGSRGSTRFYWHQRVRRETTLGELERLARCGEAEGALVGDCRHSEGVESARGKEVFEDEVGLVSLEELSEEGAEYHGDGLPVGHGSRLCLESPSPLENIDIRAGNSGVARKFTRVPADDDGPERSRGCAGGNSTNLLRFLSWMLTSEGSGRRGVSGEKRAGTQRRLQPEEQHFRASGHWPSTWHCATHSSEEELLPRGHAPGFSM